MPHPASASKRYRQSLRRRERNQARRSAARTAVRKARSLIAAGSQEEADAAVRAASSILDRVARKGTIHANNAARRKSRLMRQLNALQSAAPEEAPRKRRTRSTTKTTASKTGGRATRGAKS